MFHVVLLGHVFIELYRDNAGSANPTYTKHTETHFGTMLTAGYDLKGINVFVVCLSLKPQKLL